MMDLASFTAAPRNQKRKTYGKRLDSNHEAFARFADSPQKPQAKPSTWSPSPSPEPAKVVSPLSKHSTGKLKRPSPKQPRAAQVAGKKELDSSTTVAPKARKRSKSPTKRETAHKRPDLPAGNDAASRDTRDNGTTWQGKRKRDEDSAEAQLLQEEASFQRKMLAARPKKQTSKPMANRGLAPLAKPSVKSTRDRSPVPEKATVASKEKKRLAIGVAPNSLRDLFGTAPKNVSSPARLEELIAERLDAYIEPVQDGTSSRTQTPLPTIKSSPRTPPRASGSPVSATSLARSGSATPRQTELWSRLLGRTDGADSPSRLGVDQLRISSSSKLIAATSLQRASSDLGPSIQPRRGRLIDTLAKHVVRESTGTDTDEDETMTDEVSDLESFTEEDDIAHRAEAQMAAASISQGTSRVTYGQGRSYMDDPGLETEMLDVPFVPVQPSSSATYGSQRQAPQPLPASSQDDDDKDDSQGAMKSVHELRAKGESRRFADDFENLLEDIQYRNSASWSRQRSGVLELCEKLMDKSFVGRMVDAGLDERFLKACSGVPDTAFNFAVAAAVALIASAEVSLTVLRHIQQSECFDMLFELLPLETDMKLLAKERKSNMSKVAQQSLSEFCDKLNNAPLWNGGNHKTAVLSPHFVALQAIEGVVRRMRRLGHMDDLLDEKKTSTLLSVLESRVRSHLTAQKSELQQHDTQSLELALSTLEAGSVIPGRIQSAWTPRRMDRLAKVLPDILDPQAQNATVLTPLALRLMLNLTNGKAAASAAFADARLVQLLVSTINNYFQDLTAQVTADSGEDTVVDDRLILALGAMINLADFADAARVAVLGEHQHLLNGLLDTFLENRGKAAEADSLSQTAFNVAYGYLAVLLGNLCETGVVKGAVATRLPGGNLTPLVEAIDEFVAYNRAADRAALESEEGGSVWRVFTERLANVAEKLREH